MKIVNFVRFYLVVISCLTVENFFASGEESPRKRGYSFNESPMKNIRQALSQEFTSPMRVIVQTNLDRVQQTPGDSQKIISREVVDYALDRLVDCKADPIIQNNQLINALISPQRPIQRKVAILHSATRRLSESDKENISVVDLQHSTTPTVKKDKSGKKDILSGGHCLEDYTQPSSLIPAAKHCFISQDGSTLGINVGMSFKKTVRSGFNQQDVYESFKNSKAIARDNNSQMFIYCTQEDEFIAGYRNKQLSIKIDTVFPVLVAKMSEQDACGNIKIGSFGVFSSDYEKMDNVQPIKFSLAECQLMMKHGKKLSSEPGLPELFDVTKLVEAQLKPELTARGFYQEKLPGKLFILDDVK